jgi:hypothetical protein
MRPTDRSTVRRPGEGPSCARRGWAKPSPRSLPRSLRSGGTSPRVLVLGSRISLPGWGRRWASPYRAAAVHRRKTVDGDLSTGAGAGLRLRWALPWRCLSSWPGGSWRGVNPRPCNTGVRSGPAGRSVSLQPGGQGFTKGEPAGYVGQAAAAAAGRCVAPAWRGRRWACRIFNKWHAPYERASPSGSPLAGLATQQVAHVGGVISLSRFSSV